MKEGEGDHVFEAPDNLSNELLFGAAASRQGPRVLDPERYGAELLPRIAACLVAVEAHAQGTEEILEIRSADDQVLGRFHTFHRRLVWAEAQGVTSPLVPALRDAVRRQADGAPAVVAKAKKIKQLRPLELLEGYLPKGSLSLPALVLRHLAHTAVALARHPDIGTASLRVWTATPGTNAAPWAFGAGKVLATACLDIPEVRREAEPFPGYLREILHEIPAAVQLVDVPDRDPIPVFTRGIDHLRLDESVALHRAVRRIVGSPGSGGVDGRTRAVMAHVDHQGWVAIDEHPSLILIPLRALTESGRVMASLMRELCPAA